FTWRDTKADLTQYLEELNAQPLREFFRPHLFVNTPDINPHFLQRSGRAGFVIRAALAGFMSGLWGMYSGFELCESAAVQDGEHTKEEYLDSEKYQIKVRSWLQPGNIVSEIALINRIRRATPALHSHLGLKFHRADNDQIIFFSKTLSEAHDDCLLDDIVLVAINLDPFNTQESTVEVPLHAWGLPDDSEFAIEDLVSGSRWVWRGKQQSLRLDPAALPFLVWRVSVGNSRNPSNG
ncbi:MAG: alpha,4-glucan--maltose-phosphate maltosyltransferase, partial [Rhodocyclales bacterium]|nr:alpha,4-glucan--maltose-phosphate maltosyltransferase [Rhodocyclales bacterium]